MLAVLKEKLADRGLAAAIHQMDVRLLALDKTFALALIPFNSFAELLSSVDRQEVLARIHAHLKPGGKLICTLHNPAARLKRVDGQLRLWGSFPYQDREGKLLLWGLETYDPEQSIVQGLQLYEEYDERGAMRAKRILETKFAMIGKEAFEESARAAGFEVDSLFGDYSYSDFQLDESPFMIWVLRKA